MLNEPLRFKCIYYYNKSCKVSNVSTVTDDYFIVLGKVALPGGSAMRCEEPVSTAAKVWLSDRRPGF